MKKILSLTLVLVLVLSSFSMAFAGTSQKFEDVSDADVLTAVERLSGFGIVDGYEDGTYKPEGMVTRAEFSKMLVSALGLENAVEAAKGSSQFTDVTGTEWYAGAVNVAAGQGVVGGYPDGTFKPNAQVTYGEAVTMLVRALGYKDEFLPGTWPSNYVAKAAQLDITDDVKFFATGYADRGSVAVLVNNTLDANVIEQDTFGDEDNWKENDHKTLLTENLDITKYEAIKLVGSPKVASNLDADQVEFAKTGKSKMNSYDEDDNEFDLPNDFEVNEEAMLNALENRLGESLNVYANDDDEIVYYETAKNEYQVVWGTILSGDVDTTDEEITVTFVDGDDKTYDYEDDADEFQIYIDNEDKGHDADDLTAGLFGKFVIADNGDVALADLHNWNEEALIVTKSSDDEFDYIEATDSDETFEADDYDKVVVMDTAGNVMNLSDLAKDDIVYINEADLAESGDEAAYVVVVETAAVNETAKSYDIDTNEYEFTTDENGTYDVNTSFGTISSDDDDDFIDYKDAHAELESVTDKSAKVEILFDIVNDVRHIRTDVDVSSTSQFGIILGTDIDGFNSDEVQVKLLNSAEEEVIYDLDHSSTGKDNDYLNLENVTFDNSGSYSDEESLKDLPEGLIVKYTLNSDGDIDSLIAITKNGTDELTANANVIDEDIFITSGILDEDIEDDSIEFGTMDSGCTVKDFTVASDVIVFDITDTDAEDMDVVDFESLVDKGNTQQILVVGNDDEEAELIIVNNQVASDDEFVAYILDTREKDDVHYFEMDVYGEGVVEYEVDTDFVKEDEIAEESIVVFTKNSDDTIEIIAATDEEGRVSANDSTDFEFVIGQVTVVDGDWLTITNENGTEKVKLYSDSVVYEDDDEDADIDKYDFVLVAKDGTKGRIAKRYDIDYSAYSSASSDETMFEENYADLGLTFDASDFTINGETGNGSGSVTTDGTVTYINADGTKIAIEGDIVTLDADTILYDADDNIVAVGNVSIESALTVNDEISEMVSVGGVVTSLTASVIQTVDAANQTAADAVDTLIEDTDLDTPVATTDEAKIVAARTAFDALTNDQEALVKAANVTRLAAAEASLDQAFADAVDTLIEDTDLDTPVATTDEAKIVAARTAFDALTNDQEALVKAANVTRLAAAEASLVTAIEVAEVAKYTVAADGAAMKALLDAAADGTVNPLNLDMIRYNAMSSAQKTLLANDMEVIKATLTTKVLVQDAIDSL